MTDRDTNDGSAAKVVAVSISPGGVPKTAIPSVEVGVDGLDGDGRAHDKHRSPDRAVSIQDIEILEELKREGYPVGPGIIGENLTVQGLHVQTLSPGDRLHFDDGLVVELTEARKPCFVLDKIDPKIKDVVVGRCGYLARVIQPGRISPGQAIRVETKSG